MTKAILKDNNTITSLELLEQINFFRKEEGKKKELQHKTLLNIIRDEFDDEIHEQKILLMFRDVKIGNGATRKEPYYILTIQQGKQVLTRESKFVRKKVIHRLEELENYIQQPKQKILSVPEFLFEQSKLMIEYDERLSNIENKIANFEKNNNLVQYSQSNITVSEFAELKKLSKREYIPRNLGARATKVSKKLNLPMGKIYKHNIKDGKVKGRYFINTYHIKALEQAYSELKEMEFRNINTECSIIFK